MLRRAFILLLLVAQSAAAASGIDGLPKRVQGQVWDMIRACNAAGGRPGDPMLATEAVSSTGTVPPTSSSTRRASPAQV